MSDREWDRLYDPRARALSRIHWTPVAVAKRAATLLLAAPEGRVLDVGSGVGKFCMIGALTTAGHFTGIEQRPALVARARKMVRYHHVERCRFLAGDAAALDWTRFDAFYLYNPFQEHLDSQPRIDDEVEFSKRHYARYIALVESWLARMPAHTRLVTYNGFGGTMPAGWELRSCERLGLSDLELWVRAAPA